MDDLLFGSASPFFSGSVAEAIAKAKKEDCLLVVYLFDPASPLSASLEEGCWSDVLLVDQLNKHVAIRLSSTSTEYAQFCQLFKVSACPSVCFISSKGDVLQVVSGVAELTASNLGQVLQVLVLKRTLELRRQAAAKEEEEKQKQAELKRREDAKIVADARKAQEDRRLVAEASKTREAQEANRRHRDEVVNKVRMERKERMGKSSENNDLSAPPLSVVAAEAPSASAAPTVAHAKIKFVIGDETFAHTFSASDTLGTLRSFVASRGYSRFSLETVFPRRTLAASQDGLTLKALGLTPACAIVVSLSPNATLQSVGGTLVSSSSSASASASSSPAPGRAFPVIGGAAGSPTVHPNVDPTYVHPSDSNTFVNSIVSGAMWLVEAMRSCGRGRQRVVAAADARRASAPAPAPPRTRPGGYEELQQDI